MKRFYLLLIFFGFISCNNNNTNIKDDHSFAKPEEAIVRHLNLDIAVNFEKKEISGKAAWDIKNVAKGNQIIFDINGLRISKVTIGEKEKPTKYVVGDSVAFHGRPLTVTIQPDTKKVTIYYKSSPDAVALQWLTPQQTADKKKPFLFSQGESIWSRTWIPCQDSPSIRFTYDARVRVPSDLIAVMSAVNPQEKNSTGIYTFQQEKAIPSYLMAIAVGDLKFKAIDRRTGVYAEPSLIDKAAWEFAQLGDMVNAAEKLYGPYRWGRYDVLVLPPSFPYGGMENPNLTFLTPGVLAGDRSLTSLLAHELGHSWSGNLVTNATWDDIWLNEGFTTYVEHRIGEEIFGKDEADMQDVLSRNALRDDIAEFGAKNPDTRLKVNTHGRNPDDGLSDIPYEKGYAFLQVVEKAVGRKKMDEFLRTYFDVHAFRSITTEEFVSYFNEHLINGDKALEDKIKPEQWIYQPGLPGNVPTAHSTKFATIDSIQKVWRKSGVAGLAEEIKSTNERQHFIDHLPSDLSTSEMALLDSEFHFTKKGNFVIKRQWFVVAIRKNYAPAHDAIEKFMISTSRTGSLETLYKQMVKTAQGKEWARQIFAKARPGYHATTVQSIEKIIK